jgi:hypothetical protein
MALDLKVIQELGFRQVGLFALYRLLLRSDYLSWVTPRPQPAHPDWLAAATPGPQPLFPLPTAADLEALWGEQGLASLLAEADEIVSGKVHLFGSVKRPLQLSVAGKLFHWTVYEQDPKKFARAWAARRETPRDIKFIWEAGRFGWAYTLGRAYHVSRDERYAASFWTHADRFLSANPPYLGPHWVSAQEVALRLMAFAFVLQVFAPSPLSTSEHTRRLRAAIAEHAARVPPTLIYARSQNNNHLLTEAAGLYTAGLVLPQHPAARRWRRLGWRWFHYGLQSQIAADGTYMQHSTNYQRLMLQSALWMNCLATTQKRPFPDKSRERLAAATLWLSALVDSHSGRLPNLGPNDGAYILPLTICPFEDYRPVLQAAGHAFLGRQPFEPGVWDEMALWLAPGGKEREVPDRDQRSRLQVKDSPHVLRSPSGGSWGYLRCARFTGRPGHADQLHFDLWWRGLNVAQDAGTYLYNADPPWDNRLACSDVHNTVTVDGRDQMRRAGRFLYLDWAQAQIIEGEQAGDGSWRRLVAQHDGYRGLGITHRRSVTALDGESWLVEDVLLPAESSPAPAEGTHTAVLHWLLPDWPWDLGLDPACLAAGQEPGRTDSVCPYHLRLFSPHGMVELGLGPGSDAHIGPGVHSGAPIQAVRGGELILGSGTASPTWGWSSPTYGDKIPALSIRMTLQGRLPISFTSRWIFPGLT